MQQHTIFSILFLWVLTQIPMLHASSWVLNNPYPAKESQEKIYYSSFTEQPKTLDPVRAYSINEYLFLAQIYEPLLDYDYLKRPYEIIPGIASAMPEIKYFDTKGTEIPREGQGTPAYSVYTLRIKQGVKYQPHPALAKSTDGKYLYLDLPEDYLDDHDIHMLKDFKSTGTRELIIDDYIYQIKRLANPQNNSPIASLMSEYILGFKEFSKSLPKHEVGQSKYIDLRKYDIKGVKKIDDYSFEITIKGLYPQFSYWLSMPFFSPIPWEADKFYSQPDMKLKNLTFGWYPIGTGPFMLTVNNPNRRMILMKNPNFHDEYFPKSDSKADLEAGYLVNAGKRLPIIDKAVYSLEKETLPRWNKFLQGYYDSSTVTSDSFDQAIHINEAGVAVLSEEMLKKNIYLDKTLEPSTFYLGFNMFDPIVGGNSERARKLRQAISIAINYEERIAIFYNGRGIPAQGPLPPGIFGNIKGEINTYVYTLQQGKPQRRPIEDAKKLMIEADYPNGIDPKTGKPLILQYDVSTTGSPEDKALFDWMRKQFAKIGIDLNVQATLYNRFQEKVRTGNIQIYTWGWIADYPDPENFLFLLYGRNGKVKHGGENASNYQNPEFDRLFDLMKNRPNDELRQQLIEQLMAIARHDAPWVWGYHPEDFLLSQSWVTKIKQNPMDLGSLKYVDIDVPLRNKLREQWNQPIFWPLAFLLGLIILLLIPIVIAYFKKEKQPAIRVNLL